MKRCIRDNKGRFAKHDWQDHESGGQFCSRCHIRDYFRGLLKDLYIHTLRDSIYNNISFTDMIKAHSKKQVKYLI